MLCVDSVPPHPELLFNGAGVGLRVQAVHVVVDRAQLIGRDGGVPAETRLQDGVVDEDVLLLRREGDKLDSTGGLFTVTSTTVARVCTPDSVRNVFSC